MIIKIKNLEITTSIGVYDWEKDFKRKLLINVEIESNDHKSTASDNLADTIDYDEIVNKIKNTIQNNRFDLIEKLAQSILNSIMEDKRILKSKIEVDKMNVFEDVESFSVTLSQTRQ